MKLWPFQALRQSCVRREIVLIVLEVLRRQVLLQLLDAQPCEHKIIGFEVREEPAAVRVGREVLLSEGLKVIARRNSGLSKNRTESSMYKDAERSSKRMKPS